jgi:hypothetical protein
MAYNSPISAIQKFAPMNTTEKTYKITEFISKKFEVGELDNDSLIQIIKECGWYLNLMTISDYARLNKMSYNGVKNHRKLVSLFDVTFVIDND